MKTVIIVAVILILAAGLGAYWLKYSKSRQRVFPQSGPNLNKTPGKSELTGKMIVDSLTEMNYFRFTAAEELVTLKKEIESGYDEFGLLSTTYDEQRGFRAHCNRLYHCDGEALFEIGGLEDMLREVKPTFDLLHIPLQWEEEYWNVDATLHTIVLNGKKYEAYKGEPDDMLIWGHATKNFVTMLNDQLALHQSQERVFPLLYGNDGRIIFLTQQQFEFIQRHFRAEVPQTIEAWWEEGTR